MPDVVDETSLTPRFLKVDSNQFLIGVTREGRQFVWSPACLDWLRMEQPLINVSTLNVLVSGPVSVTGDVSVRNIASVDVTDRALRALGAISSLAGNVSVQGNVSVFPGALTSFNVQGNVSAQVAGNVSADVTDRVARLLGVVASVGGNVSADVTDRVARLLGVVASLGGNVSVVNSSLTPLFNDVTDRTNRVLGGVSVMNPVSVTGQVSILGPVSVTGQVSVGGNVSVSPVAGSSFNVAQGTGSSLVPWSMKFEAAQPVSFASTQQIDVTDRTARLLGAISSLAGNVSVQGNVSVFPGAATSFNVQGNVSAVIVGAVSVTGQVSILGPVSITGQVSVLGNVSTVMARVALDTSPATRASVGTANTLILQSNASRSGLVLMNPTSINVYFGISSPASLGAGIFLAPNGVWQMDQWTFTRACINAIASAAAVASIGIQEFL